MVLKKDFKYAIVEANNLDELYFFTLRRLLERGRKYKIDSGSYDGDTRIEFDTYKGIVFNPTQRPLAPIPKEGVPVPTTEDKIIKYFTNYLFDGNLQPHEEYKYSSWVVGIPEGIPLDKKGIPRGTRLNQLEWCIKHFKEKGYGTNHCWVTIGCAEGLQRYDWTYKKENKDTDRGTTECLRGFALSIREDEPKEFRLDLECFFRSWDLVGGLPENLGGLTMLMEYVCSELGDVKPGALIANSSGLHIYGFYEDLAKIITGLEDKK